MQTALASRGSTFLARTAAVQPCRLPVAPAKVSTVDVVAGMGGKLKTRKAASKRLKVTGSGKVMARHSGKQHLNEKMTRKEIREAGKMFVVEKSDIPNVTSCLPYGKVGKK
ncbi:plastid ribosomal protein L35 [Dunaliella salina]|uniref:50S ribosomal protein L35 n=1 Tax=Dunaliella salina TaxID=3046 RepID=A0ABQ7GX12_DUNSA|nr:plastid ribosomal protein L35 [Dunaliella salina]|eukprot:KAF5839146.1 plastid ribosomal protein L35 [Dunaliella salina]